MFAKPGQVSKNSDKYRSASPEPGRMHARKKAEIGPTSTNIEQHRKTLSKSCQVGSKPTNFKTGFVQDISFLRSQLSQDAPKLRKFGPSQNRANCDRTRPNVGNNGKAGRGHMSGM